MLQAALHVFHLYCFLISLKIKRQLFAIRYDDCPTTDTNTHSLFAALTGGAAVLKSQHSEVVKYAHYLVTKRNII
jgi:hypothetical protein